MGGNMTSTNQEPGAMGGLITDGTRHWRWAEDGGWRGPDDGRDVESVSGGMKSTGGMQRIADDVRPSAAKARLSCRLQAQGGLWRQRG